MSAISALFASKGAGGDQQEGKGLSNLFSEASLQKFARVTKPAEFVLPKKVVSEGDDAKAKKSGPKKRVGKKAKWDDAKRQERDLKVAKRTDSGETAAVTKITTTTVSSVKSTTTATSIKSTSNTSSAVQKDEKLKPKKRKADELDPETEKKAEVPQEVPLSTEDSDLHDAAHDATKNHVTAFFGNVPITETAKSVKKYCSQFGEVDCVRLRSIPVAGTAVDDAGNQNLVRKVCANSRNFMDIKGSFNAYVVFKAEEAVTAALSANNQLWGTRHLRVDRMKPTLFDPKRSVFIGSLPHYTDEEDLRNHFAKVLPYGHDDIEGVRLVRDPETLVGKGIGYLLLRDRDAVMTALSLDDQMFKKIRKLRVTTCGKRTKRTGGVGSHSGSSSGSLTGQKRSSSSSGEADEHRSPKKPKKSSKQSPNLLNAKKRINLKSANTRNKALVAKKQKKATPGKKGKRLGGVVKRAMKAANAKKK